jgi:CRP/FNR family transcriptional regulator, cyclic AMP receptor protein
MAHPTAETIGRVPLFNGLENRDLKRLADAFKERRYAAGQTIAREGETGAGFFVIGEGTASVSVEGEERASLGAGDYFGEIALIDPEARRTATLTAQTDMVCYGLTVWEFRPIVEHDGRIAWKLLQVLARRLREAEHRHHQH